MPAMPRFNKKGTKVAYDLLGKPSNIAYKPTPKEKKIKEQLLFQDTTRVRQDVSMDKLYMMMADTFYDRIDPRRRREVADSRMVREDHRAMANLPEKGFQRQFDPQSFNRSPWLDDEIGSK